MMKRTSAKWLWKSSNDIMSRWKRYEDGSTHGSIPTAVWLTFKSIIPLQSSSRALFSARYRKPVALCKFDSFALTCAASGDLDNVCTKIYWFCFNSINLETDRNSRSSDRFSSQSSLDCNFNFRKCRRGQFDSLWFVNFLARYRGKVLIDAR